MNGIVKSIMNNKAKRKTFYILVIVDLIVLAFCLMSNKSVLNALISFLITLLILDSIIWLMVGFIKKCPYCSELFAMSKINSQFISASQSTMKVRNKVRNGYGRIVATVEDNIPAVKREYLNTYKCMYCGKTKQCISYVKTRD